MTQGLAMAFAASIAVHSLRFSRHLSLRGQSPKVHIAEIAHSLRTFGIDPAVPMVALEEIPDGAGCVSGLEIFEPDLSNGLPVVFNDPRDIVFRLNPLILLSGTFTNASVYTSPASVSLSKYRKASLSLQMRKSVSAQPAPPFFRQISSLAADLWYNPPVRTGGRE